jgi:hypothetical protein
MFLNIFSTKFSTTKCVVYQYFINFITKVVKSGAKMHDFRPSAAPAKFSCICTVELAEFEA